MTIQQKIERAISLRKVHTAIHFYNDNNAETGFRITKLDGGHCYGDRMEGKEYYSGWIIDIDSLVYALKIKTLYITNPTFINRYYNQQWYKDAKMVAFERLMNVSV